MRASLTDGFRRPRPDHCGPVRATSADPDFWYALYGLRVRSDIPLWPLPQLHAQAPNVAEDLRIHVQPAGADQPVPTGRLVAGLPCRGPCHEGRLAARVYRGPAGTWFWHDGIATTHVHPGARHIQVYPHVGADAGALVVALTGPVATLVLHQRGHPSLHASAVQLGGRAVAFLGPPGQGKSTMAAMLLERGAAFISDDVLPLEIVGDSVRALASVPLMKLARDTRVATQALGEPIQSAYGDPKKQLHSVAEARTCGLRSSPLEAIYLLERYDPIANGFCDVNIRPLTGRDRLAAVLAYTLNRALLEPAENAVLLPLYFRLVSQARVAVLTYPHGFEHRDRVYHALWSDLETA